MNTYVYFMDRKGVQHFQLLGPAPQIGSTGERNDRRYRVVNVHTKSCDQHGVIPTQTNVIIEWLK